MKRLILFLIACAVALTACTDYYHHYEVEVTFENGDKEVFTIDRESFNGNDVELVMSTHKKIPTLYHKCGDVYTYVASYVRSYKVLKHTKKEVKE